MEVVMLIFSVVVFLMLCIAVPLMCSGDLVNSIPPATVAIAALVIEIIICIGCIADKSPTPIDVYRNKTELKISYDVVGNDTIVNDSTVIWKQSE